MSAGWFALGGVALAAFFAWLQRLSDRKADARLRREERFANEMARTREEAAATLARLRSFLTDLYPKGLSMNFRLETVHETYKRIGETWEQLRDPLGVLAVRLPTVDGRELADQVIAAVHNTEVLVSVVLIFMAENKDYDSRVRAATQEWDHANDLAKQLREMLHQTEPSY